MERELELLYRERALAFRRMARSLAGSDEAARDAVQEGFARALRGRSSFRHSGTLSGWVWRCVVRAALDARTGDRDLSLDAAIALAGPDLPEPDRNPALIDALRGLTPRQRMVVFLRYHADLSLEQIAQAIDTTPATASATLSQATARLRKQLTPAEVEP